MGKIAEHPIAVSISLMASVAGILTYYHQYWSSPSSTQEPAAASRQQSSDLEPASVYKPEWWIVTVIGEKPQMSGYFVDRASLRIDGSIRQAWAQLQNPVADSDGVVWFKNYSEYDCKNKSYRQIEGWKKTSDGSVIGGPESSSEFHPIPPDSIGMEMLNFICFGESRMSYKTTKENLEESVKAINQ